MKGAECNDWHPPDVVEMKFSGKRIWRPFFPLSLSVRICLLPHAQMPPISGLFSLRGSFLVIGNLN